MKVLFCLLFASLACLNVFGQTEQPAEITVEEIALARDDGNGKPGETVDNFLITDVPLHCLIQLSSVGVVAVKMNLFALKPDGQKAGADIVVASYTTTKTQNRVSFSASPDGSVWLAGKYRINVSLNSKSAKTLDFEIRKAVREIDQEKKNFVKPVLRRSKIKRTFSSH